jgi:serine/threonine-protein kinase RsbW
VGAFVSEIGEKVAQFTGSQDYSFQVKLALEEALTNAVRHGNKLDPSRSVAVSVELKADSVSIDVHDQGSGFDPDAVPDPTAPERSDKPSGRGVFLMRKIMDSVEYYDKGCGIRMTKRF